MEAAETSPKGRIPDLGGPKAEQLKSLAVAYLARTQQKKRIVPLRVRPPGKAMRNGALIPAPGSAVGRQTFLDRLDAIDGA